MKRLIRFRADFRRCGRLEGLFVLDVEGYARLLASFGKTAHFGEVLGKHSECSVTLGAEHFDVTLIDEHFAKQLMHTVADGSPHLCGYNPLDYLPADEVKS